MMLDEGISNCKCFKIQYRISFNVAHRPRAKTARDIGSYALFGHVGVNTHTYTHASGICIPDYTSRVDRIAVRAAGSELDCTYIFIYLSYAADNFSMSF